MDSAGLYRRWEVRGRRPDATHPDRCGKLHCHGVAFALPPRGLRIVPRFQPDGRVRFELIGEDRWGELDGLLRRVAGALRG